MKVQQGLNNQPSFGMVKIDKKVTNLLTDLGKLDEFTKGTKGLVMYDFTVKLSTKLHNFVEFTATPKNKLEINNVITRGLNWCRNRTGHSSECLNKTTTAEDVFKSCDEAAEKLFLKENHKVYYKRRDAEPGQFC